MSKIIFYDPTEIDLDILQKVVNNVYSPLQKSLVQFNISFEFLKGVFVYFRNDQPMATCAVYYNPDLIYKEQNAWCIGNYECVQDNEVADNILDAAFSFIKKNNGKYVIGPMNGSTWENYRFSTNTDQLFFTESYHHSYYNSHFIKSGFQPIANYFSSVDHELKFNQPEVLRLESKFKQAGVKIRCIDIDNYEHEIDQLYPFITGSFSSNFLYTPISRDRFIEKYLPIKNFIHSMFVLIAENEQREICGVFFCLPNHYDQREKSLVIKTISRSHEERYRGLGHVMANCLYANAATAGYTKMIHAFMYRQGTSVTISKNYSGEVFKDYVLYGKEI